MRSDSSRLIRRQALAALLAMAAPLAAQDTPPADAGSITIGSKAFTESRVLAEIARALIEAKTDVTVTMRTGLGGTTVCWDALRTGEIDLYFEYTGTAWNVILGESEPARDPLRTFLRVARRCASPELGVTALDPLGFENTYAIAMLEERAAALSITRISDLAKGATAAAGSLSAGFTHEFLERQDGFPGLRDAYGLQFAQTRGLEHGLAYTATREGEIDVMDAYSTDGKLLRFGMRILEDDLGYFPPYHAVPLLLTSTAERLPAVRTALDSLSFALDASTMQGLNAAVTLDEREIRDVAEEFVAGLLDREGTAHSILDRAATRSSGPGKFALEILGFAAEHLLLTALAVLLAALIAIPLGIWIASRPTARAIALGTASVLQTIPSLALLALMVPVLGLGTDAATLALMLYAILPILRNTCTGIVGIDPTLIDAARGLGMRPREILRIVQLPLAIPTIMAGVRTATVISVGVATLAAFIGAGGLGTLIRTGLDLYRTDLILAGAIPAALLAIALDLGLSFIERRLQPRTRMATAA